MRFRPSRSMTVTMSPAAWGSALVAFQSAPLSSTLPRSGPPGMGVMTLTTWPMNSVLISSVSLVLFPTNHV